MALGILEPKGIEHVVGTVYVGQQGQQQEHELGSNNNLKRDPTGKILVPQPSDDPNDPLVRAIPYLDA